MDREVGSRRLTVRWDATVYPGVIIRDPASGTTLGIGTGGSLVVQPLTDVIDVTYSDGVRSQTRRVVVDDR
jgi:hypothetical protein